MIELQVGKSYWCRGGDIVSIIAKSDHRKPFTGLLWTHTEPIVLHFYPDGHRRRKEFRDEWGNDLQDLIEERD